MSITPQTYGSLNPLLKTPKKTALPPVAPVATPPPTRAVAPVAPASPAPAPVTPAPGSVAAITPRETFTYSKTAEDIAADAARARLLAINGADANTVIDPQKEYRAKLKMYQAQIDATNAVYNDQLNASRVAGQGRLGSSRASQGRSGLLGSDFGAAQTDTITTANQEADAAVQNERQVAISSILGLARKDALDAVTAKTAAKKAGADALLKYYSEDVPAQKAGRLNKVAKALFDKAIDPSTLTPGELKQLSTDWNVSADDISSAYNDLKTTSEASASKAELETNKAQAEIDKINADIAKGKLIELSEGGMLYNTETGETFKNPKTYAPTSSGDGVTPLGTASPFVAQPNYSKLNAKQKSQADSLNNLVRSLGEYKTYYNENPGAFGGAFGNMFGGDAGVLETKLNSIIFAAAQAEGTGALQAADREVIERIVPNPTNLSGAINTAKKGGKQGNIKKIDDQIAKYVANLAGLGLAPVNSGVPGEATGATGSGATLTSPDGTQEVDVSSLTPAELQEARDAGWQ